MGFWKPVPATAHCFSVSVPLQIPYSHSVSEAILLPDVPSLDGSCYPGLGHFLSKVPD